MGVQSGSAAMRREVFDVLRVCGTCRVCVGGVVCVCVWDVLCVCGTCCVCAVVGVILFF